MTSNVHLQPDGLCDSRGFAYSQVVVSPPGRTVAIAGQTAWDAEQQLVGEGDIAAQAKQVLDNIELALVSAGASKADLTQLRVYIVDYSPALLEDLMPVFHQFWGEATPAAQTMLGVAALAMPQFLIEIDAVAVVANA
jgi:enamine deaminase RidA (YjgF/YER057c/UK114 family)